MTRTEAVLIALLLSLAAGVAGVIYGKGLGVTEESARRDGKAVADLTKIIGSHEGLIKDASAASRRLRKAVAVREVADDKTTKEVSNELAATSDSRTGCIFPTGVMRELAAARERSAQAASSGIGGTVPAARGSAAPDR